MQYLQYYIGGMVEAGSLTSQQLAAMDPVGERESPWFPSQWEKGFLIFSSVWARGCVFFILVEFRDWHNLQFPGSAHPTKYSKKTLLLEPSETQTQNSRNPADRPTPIPTRENLLKCIKMDRNCRSWLTKKLMNFPYPSLNGQLQEKNSCKRAQILRYTQYFL